MQTYHFDDRNVAWQTVEFVGGQIYVLAVDERLGISDGVIRFQPNMSGQAAPARVRFQHLRLAGRIAILGVRTAR